jgi:uncharacterized protein YraI
MMKTTRTFMGGIICAAAFLAVSVEMATAAPARLAVNTHLRMGPGTRFGIITTVHRGAIVDVIRCTALWCNVLWHGRPGYVIARNLGRRAAVRIVRPLPPPPVVIVGPPFDYGPYYGPYYYGYYGPRFYYGPRRRRRWRW